MTDNTENGPGIPASASPDGTSEPSSGLVRRPALQVVPAPAREAAVLAGGLLQPALLPKLAECLERVSHIGGEEAEAGVHLLTEAIQHPRAIGLAGAGAGAVAIAIVLARKSAQDQKLSATESSSSAIRHFGLSVTYPGSPYSVVFYQSPTQPAGWKQLGPELQQNLLEEMGRSAGKDTGDVADPVSAVISELHRRRAEHPDEPDP